MRQAEGKQQLGADSVKSIAAQAGSKDRENLH
jgi:hypothetical protein